MNILVRGLVAIVAALVGSFASASLGFSVGEFGSAHFWGAIVWAIGCYVVGRASGESCMTNVTTPRYLEPSEIELWELAQRATPGPWRAQHGGWRATGLTTNAPQTDLINASGGKNGCDVLGPLHVIGDDAGDANAVFISKANPLTVAALLETLEKTRERRCDRTPMITSAACRKTLRQTS